MRQRVLILAAVALVVGAVIPPNLRSCGSQKTQVITVITIKAARDIEPGTIITTDMVMVEREEQEGEHEVKKDSSSVAEAASTKLDQVVGKVAKKLIKEGEDIGPTNITSDYIPPGKVGIGFDTTGLPEGLGGILKRGYIVDLYAFHSVREDEPARKVKIAACIQVVDSYDTGGNPARRQTFEAEEREGSGIVFVGGGGGGEGERIVPARVVIVAVEPEIADRIIEFLGSRGYQAWLSLPNGSCWMPTPTPTPTPIPPTPTPIPPTPTSTPTPTPMPPTPTSTPTSTPIPPTPTPTPTPGPRSDLVPSITSDSLMEDQPGTVLVEVKNEGPADMTTECLVGLYTDRPAKGDPDKLMVCPALGVGESAVISYTVTLDEAGYHLLSAWADVLEEIAEEDETNNKDSASIHVIEPPTPTPTATPTNTPTPPTLGEDLPTEPPYRYHIHVEFREWWLDTVEVVDLEGRPVDLELKKISEGIYYADYYGQGFEMTVRNNGEDMDIWRGKDGNVGADVFIDGVKAEAMEKKPIDHNQERTIKVQLRDGFNEATVVLVDD